MRYLDSETCGLTGPMVLLQHAKDRGPISLWHLWKEPIRDTLILIEEICSEDVCGFNLVYDWFHLTKIYNLFRVLADNGYDDVPTPEAVAEIDTYAPADWCLKPKSALDIMLVARKSKYQYVMKRKPILIKRVPIQVAERLAEELKKTIDLPKICFTKRPYQWEMTNRQEDFVDLRLQFGGSSGLDALAQDALGEKKGQWTLSEAIMPTEADWKPYGQVGKKPWLVVIKRHISIWSTNEIAQHYARQDVHLLRRLHLETFESIAGGDTDSELACALGAARWKGYAIDHSKLKTLHDQYSRQIRSAPRGHKRAMEYLQTTLPEELKLVVKDTKKTTLEALIREKPSSEVSKIAQDIIDARKAKLRKTLIEKLMELDRFHPDFKVIGTKSNRQSGGGEVIGRNGSINPQGIARDPEIRSLFTLAFDSEVLEGGDAKSFEVTILDAVCPCPTLHKELVAGKNFHGVMGTVWYGKSYDEIMSTKEQPEGEYYKSKTGDFAFIYGAEENKLSKVLGLEQTEAERISEQLRLMFPELMAARNEVALRFCSMRQPGGIGTNVEWHEPADAISSIFGFDRYFTLENQICRFLYTLATKPPRWLRSVEGMVTRREYKGRQTISGACQSALFAAAFAIQAANMRAACNHIIQSPGGHITKEFQYEYWKEQPCGVHAWRIRIINIHDELLTIHDGTVDCKAIRDRVMERFRKVIPLIAWDWKVMASWGDK